MLAVLIASLAAYMASGDKGIEERFSQAVGLGGEPEEEEGGGGFLGFNIEGNIVSYAIILIVLLAACALLYWKFRA